MQKTKYHSKETQETLRQYWGRCRPEIRFTIFFIVICFKESRADYRIVVLTIVFQISRNPSAPRRR